jgi:hypothetical protein
MKRRFNGTKPEGIEGVLDGVLYGTYYDASATGDKATSADLTLDRREFDVSI